MLVLKFLIVSAYDDIGDSHYETSSIPEEETIRQVQTGKADTGYEEPVRHYMSMKSNNGSSSREKPDASNVYIRSDASSTYQQSDSSPCNEYSNCWDGAEEVNNSPKSETCVGTIIYEQERQSHPIYENKLKRKSSSYPHLTILKEFKEIFKLGGMRSASSVPGGLSTDVQIRVGMETTAGQNGNFYAPDVTLKYRKRTEIV